MDRTATPSRQATTHRRRPGMVAGAILAALWLAGCVSVTTNVTPPPGDTPFLGITPPPTRQPETPEPAATPDPDGTPRPTRRPRVTPKPTPPPQATPKPTKKPTPTPESTPEPTPEPTDAPTDAPSDVTPPPAGWPAGAHTSDEAANHVGESGTVCGVVAAAQYLPSLPGRPTFLNIDQPYPDQRFNVVIWGEQRRAFPLNRKPEIFMLGKTVCTTGAISAYVDWTQIAYAKRSGTDIIQ